MSGTPDPTSSSSYRFDDVWNRSKLPGLMLVIGLLVGPIISSQMGWQVSRGAAERQSTASAVDQQARICAYLAEGDIPDAAKLDWNARRELSEKYAIMPGRETAEPGVANACARLLTVPT